MTYFMLSARGLEKRLVCPSTTGNDTNHTTRLAGEDLLGTRWELDTSLALVEVVADDGYVVTGGTAERTTVPRLVFHVGKDGTFGDGSEREDVANGQSGVLAGVDELSSVHALVGDEGLGVVLEPVGLRNCEFLLSAECGCARHTFLKTTLARGAPGESLSVYPSNVRL